MAYSTYRIRLRAFVTVTLPFALPPFPGGVPLTFALEVSKFQSNWELNGIPTCSLMLPLGREAGNAGNINSISAIHFAINFMQLITPLQVYAKVDVMETSGGPNDIFPPGWFKVFDGAVTATGYKKTFGEAEFSLHGIHWLANLDFSSPFSELSHPMNPSQYTFRIHMPMPGLQVNMGATPAGASTALALAQCYFDANTITNDFWGYGGPVFPPSMQGARGGLKYWLLDLSDMRRFNWQQILGMGSPAPQALNFEMQRALNRFEPFGGNYAWGVPLSLNAGVVAPFLASAIRRSIGKETVESFSGVTMWDKLVGTFAMNYMMAIVPMVDRALVVPFNPFYRAPWASILARDYNYIEIGQPLLRPVRGVAVIAGRATAFGAHGGGEPAINHSRVDGYYEGRPDGMIIVTTAPQWMVDAGPNSYTLATSGIGSVISTAQNPLAGLGPATSPLAASVTAIRLTCDAYAKTRYLQEVLRGRSGMVSGKLRFDIGPGSIVYVEGSAEPFVKQMIGPTAAEQSIYGMVLRTSISMDAPNHTAGTAFQLGFVRNAYENGHNSFSASTHPMWNVPWRGAPIVDQPVYLP